MNLPLPRRYRLRPCLAACAALLACVPLNGCIVAGYSSGGGFFLWPGSLGLLVLIVLIVLFAMRR